VYLASVLFQKISMMQPMSIAGPQRDVNAPEESQASRVSTIICFIVVSVLTFSSIAFLVYTLAPDMQNVGIGSKGSLDPETHLVVNGTKTNSEFNAILHRTIRTLRALKTDLEVEWRAKDFPVFFETLEIPKLSYELQMHKFAVLILGFYFSGEPTKFVFGMAGSSVTAGHDNYLTQAYPAVLEKTLGPVFDILGVSLEVRNGAIGNNPCFPYDLCTNAHLGEDLDVLTWEHSFNCGHEPVPIEAFVRNAIFDNYSPTIMFLLSGTPFWPSDSCGNATVDRNIRKEDSKIANQFKNVASDLNWLSKMGFLRKNSSVGDEQSLHHVYPGVAFMGQNLASIANFKCQGPFDANWSTRGAEGGHNWHPGVKGHRFRAHTIAYGFADILQSAIESLLRVSPSGTENNDMQDSHLATILLASRRFLRVHRPSRSIEPVSGCSDDICGSTPKCYTEFQPLKAQVPSVGLKSRVVGKTDWPMELSIFDSAGAEKGKSLGIIDRKMVFYSTNSSALSLRVTLSRRSSVWLCELQRSSKTYPPGYGNIDEESIIYLDEQTKDYDQINGPVRPEGKKLQLKHTADYCYATPTLEKGGYILRLRQKRDKSFTLTYILTW
jgi:hypothetical protein